MTRLSVAAAADDTPDRPALWGDGPPLTYAALAEAVRRRPQPRGPIALTPDGGRESILDVLAALESREPIALLHARWTEAERADATARFRAAAQPGDIVVFTSGSSGRPKGVRLSRDALVAAADAHAAALPFEDHDRWLLTLPLAHVGGLSVLTRCLVARACVAVGPPSFDATSLREAVEASQTTLLSIVPTMMERMLPGDAPPSLRAVLLGGAAASASLVARAREAGWPVLPTYGASETCGQACTQRLADLRPSGVGPPLPSVQVRLLDGDIQVGGPTVMRGYLDDPSPLVDGWFRTGDRGVFDEDGHLHVRGRRDAVLITGGENVDPVEVEQALTSHPKITHAFVTGLPDPEWGQRIVALVVGERGVGERVVDEQSALDEARAHLRGQLARFKHPKALAHVPELPLLPNGKIDRQRAHTLAAQLLLDRAGPA